MFAAVHDRSFQPRPVIVRHRVSLREPDDRLQRTIQYAVPPQL